MSITKSAESWDNCLFVKNLKEKWFLKWESAWKQKVSKCKLKLKHGEL